MSGRRSKTDLQWQEVRRKVHERDKETCRFWSILLPFEYEQLKNLDIPYIMFQQLDCAHIYPVSLHLDKIYDVDNVVLLSRWAHKCLDNLINPLTQNIMTHNEMFYWWVRIKFKRYEVYDKEKNYEELYQKYDKEKCNEIKKTVFDWW